MNDLQFVIKTGATGRQDITERVGDYQLRTRVPGGFWDARIEVASPERDAWLLFDSWPGGDLMVRGVGEVVWQGDAVAPRIAADRLRMTARGQALRMRGREQWEVYADAGYARWYPVESEKFDLDNNNRVWVASRQNIEYSTWEFGEVRYPESGTVLGANIARVQATVEVAIESGTWRAGFISEIGQPWLWSTTSAGTYQVDFTCDVERLSFILIALADGEGVATARATQVIIRTMNPTYGESIIADVLGDNGLDVLHLQETGLALDNALWQGDHDFAVIEDVAAFGDGQETWVFALYEEGAEYRPWGSTADWLILPEDVERWTIQEDRDDVRNAVRARLPDGWLSDWQTDADSIGLYGQREETLDVPMTTRDEATKWAQIYLAERKRAITGVQAEPGAWIHKPDGTRWPAYLVRAGDVVVIRDVVPGTDITIRVEETEVSPRGLQIIPMGGPGRLEVIWAAQARQMQQQVEILAADVTMLKSLNLAQVSGGGGAVGVDHGGLSGLADPDHPLTALTGAAVGATITGQAGPVWASLAHPGAANRVLESGAATPEWSDYTLAGYSGRTYTLPDADLTVTGGGTLALGGYTLTVPETMTVAGRDVANTFTAAQTINVSSATALVVGSNTLVVDTANDRVGILVAPSHVFQAAAGTISASETAMRIDATMPASPGANVSAVTFSMTSAGSQGYIQRGVVITLAAGYTGASATEAAVASNSAAGTSGDLVKSGNPDGNVGMRGDSLATTIGYNIGVAGFARYGDVSIGGLFRAGYTTSSNEKSGAAYVGCVGIARNVTEGGSVNIGGYFGLNDDDPTFESAALICDNDDMTVPIFLARDDGSAVVEIADGGAVTLYGQSTNGRIQFQGTVGGGDEGITYYDSGSAQRFGLIFPGSDVVRLCNRASNGIVQIAANTSTAGSGGETVMAQFEDTGAYIGGAASPTSMLDVNGDVEIGSADAYYMGDPTTDGTWRMVRSGNNLIFQRRESGSYVTKDTISA